jgi:hypothetical protein
MQNVGKGIEHLWSGSNLVLTVVYSATTEYCPRLAGFFMSHRPTQRNLVVLPIYFVATPSAFSATKLVSPVSVLVLPEPEDVKPEALLEEWAGYLNISYLGDVKAAWDSHLNDLGMKQCDIDDKFEVPVELKEEQIFGETIWVIDVAKVRSKGHRWCSEHSHFDTGKLCSHFPAQPKPNNASEITDSTTDLGLSPTATHASVQHRGRSALIVDISVLALVSPGSTRRITSLMVLFSPTDLTTTARDTQATRTTRSDDSSFL